MEVKQDISSFSPNYTCGYLLGQDALKTQFLKSIQTKLDATGYLSSGAMNLFFASEDQQVPEPTERFLPIQVNGAIPDSFNLQRYYEVRSQSGMLAFIQQNNSLFFQLLKTKEIGRLLIYIPIVTSSMDVLDKLTLRHGLVVIPKYQSNGSGRNKNKWLSAEGCLMFTVQLKIRLNSVLGQRIPLIQHLVATAITNAIVGQDGYQVSEKRKLQRNSSQSIIFIY